VSARIALAVGDVFVDYICDLSRPELTSTLSKPDREQDLFAPVTMEVGGGGAQFAIAARTSGFDEVGVIGKVGGVPVPNEGKTRLDPLAELAAQFLTEHDVASIWAVDPKIATGRACILYGPGDRRLMVSDPGANATLCKADLTSEMWQAVKRAGLVHISGYVLLQEERRAAALALMRTAKAHQATVAVDLAPHNIYNFIPGPILLDTLSGVADWFMAALPTAHRMLGYGPLVDANPRVTEKVMDGLSRWFPSIALNITPAVALLHHQGKREERHFEYSTGVASRGQSAAVQARILGALG
jgi:sugar/nucleoside kinase (ribokinase family)